MSFWFHDALSEDASLPGAGGEASLPEIADAAIQSARYVDNTFAEQAALDEGIDRRNDAIFARTGVKLDNPFRQYARNARENVAPRIAKARAEYRAQLVSLEEQHPNARDAIRSHVSIEDDAAAIARAADERLGRLSASRDEIGKWGALFAGGFRGSLEDPLQVATLAIGGGTGAARTIFGRILSTAMREALVNGGVEAALQPQVQAWRKKAGLPNGFDEGLRNVGFATVLGGAFGAAGRSIAEGGQIALRGADLARATAELAPKLTESARAALGGDIATARAVLSEIKPALPPEARGALDALDADALVSARTPKGLDAGEHARAVEATARLADGEIDAIAPDAERLSRIAAELTMDDNAAVLSNLTEPPLRSGFTRVYHSGSIGDGKFGRWVSSNRTYAANYRQNSPLHFLDLPANDGRVINADYPDQQIKQGFTFNFELTPREAKRLKEIARQFYTNFI